MSDVKDKANTKGIIALEALADTSIGDKESIGASAILNPKRGAAWLNLGSIETEIDEGNVDAAITFASFSDKYVPLVIHSSGLSLDTKDNRQVAINFGDLLRGASAEGHVSVVANMTTRTAQTVATPSGNVSGFPVVITDTNDFAAGELLGVMVRVKKVSTTSESGTANLKLPGSGSGDVVEYSLSVNGPGAHYFFFFAADFTQSRVVYSFDANGKITTSESTYTTLGRVGYGAATLPSGYDTDVDSDTADETINALITTTNLEVAMQPIVMSLSNLAALGIASLDAADKFSIK